MKQFEYGKNDVTLNYKKIFACGGHPSYFEYQFTNIYLR